MCAVEFIHFSNSITNTSKSRKKFTLLCSAHPKIIQLTINISIWASLPLANPFTNIYAILLNISHPCYAMRAHYKKKKTVSMFNVSCSYRLLYTLSIYTIQCVRYVIQSKLKFFRRIRFDGS